MRTLRWGSRGDDVRELQDGLRRHEFFSGAADGFYGAGTRSAVVAFQRASDLPPDGIADSVTQAALFGSARLKPRPDSVVAAPPAPRGVPEEL